MSSLHDADEYMGRLQTDVNSFWLGRKLRLISLSGLPFLTPELDANHLIDQYIQEYMDVLSETEDNLDKTGHGTNGVLVTLAAIPDAHARVFEEEPRDPKTPICGCPGIAIKHAIAE